MPHASQNQIFATNMQPWLKISIFTFKKPQAQIKSLSLILQMGFNM